MAKQKITAKETYRSILQTDYSEYVSYVHHGMWKKTKFHRYLCRYVQNFVERPTDKPYEILVISTPPQHGKSQTITETLPSWYLGRHPENRVIEGSYNIDFARKFGRKNRQKIDEFGEDIFGITVSKEAAQATNFELQGHRGSMLSAGIETGVTGNPADLIIIDDPVKNSQEAYSPNRRERVYDEWVASFKSRLSPGAKVIIIMTRWHEDDLAGRLLAEEKNIKCIAFPCECESADDLLGRDIGDSLCPEIGKDRTWLHQFKESMVSQQGAMTWNALYQCRPSALEGNLIVRDWWQYYDILPKNPVQWCMSVDAAFKDGDDNDFTAIQVWCKNGADIYLVDAVKKHLNFPDTVMEIRRLRGMYEDCKVTLIEDKANGTAIITMLQREMGGIIPVQPYGNKISRVQAVIGTIESGNVWLPSPEKHPWVRDFVEECSSFPNAAHDDQVDAMSQGLYRLIFQRGERFIDKPKSAMERMFPAYFANKGAKNNLGKITPI